MFSKYFQWLQKDISTGEVEKYPEINENGETSIPGIFVIRGLTGIPLLKLAAESVKKIIIVLMEDKEYRIQRENQKHKNIYDIVIVCAGLAGMAAGIEAVKNKKIF